MTACVERCSLAVALRPCAAIDRCSLAVVMMSYAAVERCSLAVALMPPPPTGHLEPGLRGPPPAVRISADPTPPSPQADLSRAAARAAAAPGLYRSRR